MLDTNRYPKFNDQQHDRPIISVKGISPLDEIIWLALPVAAAIILFVVNR